MSFLFCGNTCLHSGCWLNLLLWPTGGQIGQGEGEKNMLTLSTDLEHRSIIDMAAVLWQATEAAAPIRSLGYPDWSVLKDMFVGL